MALTTGVALTVVNAASAAPPETAAPSAVAAVRQLPTTEYLPLRLAQKAAEAAIADCQKKGYQVTATVVDVDGVVIVQLRSDGTTAASVDASKGKAYASAGFRSPADALAANAATNPGLLQVPGFVILAGGLPVASSSGKVVGGIGVGGAPSGAIDKTCAEAGLAAIG
ncbi:MAG: heme-binding protein [Lapillicoccus sp.]